MPMEAISGVDAGGGGSLCLVRRGFLVKSSVFKVCLQFGP